MPLLVGTVEQGIYLVSIFKKYDTLFISKDSQWPQNRFGTYFVKRSSTSQNGFVRIQEVASENTVHPETTVC